jgi:hypothetical protein
VSTEHEAMSAELEPDDVESLGELEAVHE